MTEQRTGNHERAGLILGLLLFSYILNFLDRQILGILAQPIKADLGLSDTEFGAIGGLAFALLYSLLGLPLAILADRTSRAGVISVSVAVWSGFTALCGTATGYWQLFLFRLGVGIGEAGGVAPAYALIAERFAPQNRARAIAIFSLGVPLGLALGTLIGAYLAEAIDWRAAFLVMGAIGLLFAPVLWWGTRGKGIAKAPAPSPGEFKQTFRVLLRKPTFWLLAFAAAMSSLTGYGLALWVPSVLIRSFGLDLIGTANFLASVLLIGGTIGMLAGGMFADRLSPRDRRWNAWLPAIAWALTAPCFAIGLMADSLWLAWPFLLLANGLNILWFGPLVSAIQNLVAPAMRASASGAYLVINNLIGLGIGPLLMGAISDQLKADYGADSLRLAAVGCLVFYLVAAVLAVLAARNIRSDWVGDAG
jgi:predicted MFS family arabinose efflux permease